MRSFAALLCLLLSVASATAQVAPEPPKLFGPPAPPAPVILISIDGFRADYLKRGVTPTLQALADDGVRALAMHPSFPSLTFPNHYTLVTGLRPDHQGVVNNTMEDDRIQPDRRFTLGTYDAVSDARWWDEASPIWVTAKTAGLRTGTLFWPGSEAAIQGVRPDLWMHFDAAISPDQRVDILLDWLALPAEKRPAFLTLYFDAVDHEAHLHGPDSPEVDAALRQTDAALARLVAGLKAQGLFRSAELVIVADHGMAATSRDRVLWLEDAAPGAAVRIVSTGATAGLDADDPALLDRYLAWRPGHAACRRKADLPARLHYGANPRVPAVVCIADSGWLLLSRVRDKGEVLAGEHGYDPADPHMDALFVAHGPAFRRGYLQPAFDNVDVYPLLARLLGVAPEPGDGRIADVAGMLAPH